MDRTFLAEIIVTDDSLEFGKVEEVPPSPFEGVALLDSFQRAPEKPLSDGGKWSLNPFPNGVNTGEIASETWGNTGWQSHRGA